MSNKRANGNPLTAAGAATDIRDLVGRLQVSRWVAAGCLRSLGILLLAMVLWNATGLRAVAKTWYSFTTRVIVARIEKPEIEVKRVPVPGQPDATRTVKALTHKLVPASLHPDLYFTLFLPVILVVFFPLREAWRSVRIAALGTLFIGLFHVLQTLVHAYYAYGIRVATGGAHVTTARENSILLTINVMAPLILTGLAVYLVERGRRRSRPETPERADAPKAPARNDPCPCGSGRKYKKCCGA